MFELPIIIYFLTKFGLVNAPFLKKYFRHAIVVILIIAAFLSPPDALSQVIVAIPMIILYGISILIAVFVGKKKDKEAQNIVK